MKDNKTMIYTILAIALVLLSLSGATYAYFVGQTDVTENVNINATTAFKSYTFAAFDDGAIELNVTSIDMLQGNGGVAGADSANMRVDLLSPSNTESTTCTYDVAYIWDSTDIYDTPDKTLDTLEFEFSIKEDNYPLTEVDLSDLIFTEVNSKMQTILFSDSITSISDSVATSNNYSFTFSIYNIDAPQTNIAGKSYQGRIVIQNPNCVITPIS